MATHNDLGKEAEKVSKEFLEKNYYQILEKNWRYLKAEIDLIAIDTQNNQLVIIEVKARTSDQIQLPEKAVNSAKKKLLILAADAYITKNNLNLEARFDVISLLFIDQIRIVFGMSDEEAIQALTYLVDNNDEIVEYMKEMRETYLGGSVQALYDFTEESFNNPKYPQGDKKAMLDDRNENWIPTIEKLMRDGSVFIGVGAAHLAGEKGVINLLRKKGYQVKPGVSN